MREDSGTHERLAWQRQLRVTALMALFLAAGFSVQLAMGRSSFSSPTIVHLHAVIFFGWVGLSVLQAAFAASGRIALHRRLGWFSVLWILIMVPVGIAVTGAAAHNARVPFFFQPQLFLFEDVASLLAFAGLAGAAILLRHDTGWHRRLHLCGLACLMGPGFGRLLPMPLLMPFAMEIAMLPGLLFPVWLAWREWRKDGYLHPAWPTGLAVLPLCVALALQLAHSPAGHAAYQATVAGGPAAPQPGLAFPAPPGG